MLTNLDHILKRFLPILTISSLICGILLGDHLSSLSIFVPWIFAFMTFSGSLGLNFKQIYHVMHHPFPLVITIILLHVLIPLWVWCLSHLFFAGDPLTITGFMLAVVIPTGTTSFIWVTIYKGNVPLALSTILIDTLIAPIVVPLSLLFFIGEAIQLDISSLMKDLFFMIVFPALIAMILNQITKGKVSVILGPTLSPFSKLAIFSIVFINGSLISSYLFENFGWKVVMILSLVLFISITGYVISWLTAKYLKLNEQTQITLMYNGGMRNIAAGVVIAGSYFPPQVVLPVVLGMLFQQAGASIFGKLFSRFNKKEDYGIQYQSGSG